MTARGKALIVTVALTLIANPRLARGQQACTPRPVALFESVNNSVQLVQASTRAPIQAARQVPVCAGDTIQVGDNSRAVLLMLGSNTPPRHRPELGVCGHRGSRGRRIVR